MTFARLSSSMVLIKESPQAINAGMHEKKIAKKNRAQERPDRERCLQYCQIYSRRAARVCYGEASEERVLAQRERGGGGPKTLTV